VNALQLDTLIQLLLSAALGGVVTFAWSQVSFGSRLTRIETLVEGLEKQLTELKEGVAHVAGHRHPWPPAGRN
jgi:hypothetical protein